MPRYRDKIIKIWVTEEERQAVLDKMKIMRMTNMGEFVRLALTTTQPVCIETDGLFSLSYEINMLGHNLNQIAKKANVSGTVYENDIEECKKIFMKAENALLSFYDLAAEIDKIRCKAK